MADKNDLVRQPPTPTRDAEPEQQSSPPPAEATTLAATAAVDTVECSSNMPPADAKEHLRAINASEEQPNATNGGECHVSSSEQTNGSGADGNEDEEEVVVTLDEVLRQDAILTETADAVLGASSETDCSYALGYLRQALYACLTCTPASEDESTRAGVCLACSYNCHEGHELIELYTKRNFRCDCGNAKFPTANPCKLVTDKAPRNDRNAYSQNFTGKYCTCHRPYPDPERTTEEMMLQCVVCEDWLHAEHVFPAPVGDAAPQEVPDDFDDFICLACMSKHPFLLAYDLDDENDEENASADATDAAAQSSAATADKPSSTAHACVLEKKLQALDASENAEELKQLRPTFWTREWRDALCKCAACVARFEKAEIAFLLDPDDSLQAYEEAAAQARRVTGGSAEDLAQRAFSSKLSHQQQVEMAIGYSHMKSSLQTYLAAFAAGGKTVRAEDIQSFFEDLREKKRQKTSSGDAQP